MGRFPLRNQTHGRNGPQGRGYSPHPLVRLLIEPDDVPARIAEPRGDFRRIRANRLHDLASVGDEGVNRRGHAVHHDVDEQSGRRWRPRSPLLRLAVRRLLTAIPVVWGVTFLGFTVLNLLPGDAAQALLGADATPAEVAKLRDHTAEAPIPPMPMTATRSRHGHC